MQRRRLGPTPYEITPIGFGAWTIGGTANALGNYGPVDDAESIAAIHRALERGVNWIDTAPGYGLGHSEEVVGRALRGLGERPYVFTKCGFVWGEDRVVRVCLRPESLRAEAEQSLRRLGVEALDLYQIHWLEPENDPEIEDAWATLAALRDEGKVREIGVSNFTPEQVRRAQAIAPVATLQPPYSLVDRRVEADLLPLAAADGIGVIVYSPMASGLLTGAMTRERIASLPEGDFRKAEPDFQEPRLSANLALVERLRVVAARRSCSPGEVAVAWTLRRPEVTGAIVGFRRPQQVDGIAGAADLVLDDDDLAELDAQPAAV